MNGEHTLYPLETEISLPDDCNLEATHEKFQAELERIGSDTIAAQLRANEVSEVGMTVYADEYIDCIVASDGLLDRIGRRAGLHPVAQRALLTHYYEQVNTQSGNLPTDKDILVIDKSLVSGYDEEL